MKLIYFSFKHRHRQKELNNFLKSRIYGSFLLLNFGGPFRFFLAKFLNLIKIGKAISCDGRPLIKNKTIGINFWMRGTYLNIPSDLRDYNNNFVSIKNPILKKDSKVFQIYPINIKKTKVRKDISIIYVSKTLTDKKINNFEVWSKFKKDIMKNFTVIDDINFWEKNFKHNTEEENFNIYSDLKILLRHEIILEVKNKYKNQMRLIGNDWKKYINDAESSTYDIKKIKNIYNGNICLDMGSTLGSLSLYPRSNQIIESGGLILQCKQVDSDKIWKNLSKKINFINQDTLINLIDSLLNDKIYCDNLLHEIKENFINSDKDIESSLKKVFL